MTQTAFQRQKAEFFYHEASTPAQKTLWILTLGLLTIVVATGFKEIPKANAINAIREAEVTTISMDGPAFGAPADAVRTFEILTTDGAGPNASCYADADGVVRASGAWEIGADNEPKDLGVNAGFLDGTCDLTDARAPA